MARPKNLIVVNNGLVYSVSPKELKRTLTALAAGNGGSMGGKLLGEVDLDLSKVPANEALSSLFPEPAVPVHGTVTPALVDTSEAELISFGNPDGSITTVAA